MQPFFDCSVPHPYKPRYRMRPHDAVRLPVPCDIPGLYVWVSPAFFVHAQATPGWFAAEELRGLDIPMALFGHPLDELEKMMDSEQSGDTGMGLGGAAAKGGSHD
jgi:hypothetical protein